MPQPVPSFTVDTLRRLIAAPQPPVLRAMWLHQCNVRILALTIDGEARDESIGVKLAIAWTILNRIKQATPGLSVALACLRSGYYPCWPPPSPRAAQYTRTMLLAAHVFREPSIAIDVLLLREHLPVYHEAEYLAAGVLSGVLRDPTKGSTRYCRVDEYGSPLPAWLALIDSFVFYREVTP